MEKKLLLPDNRTIERGAMVVSHILYDSPSSDVLETFPEFPRIALEFQRLLAESGEARIGLGRGDFESRLGVHLAFYYWNGLYSDSALADSTLEQYFESARPESRAIMVSDIARVFRKSSSQPINLSDRVMRLLENRLEQIDQLRTRAIEPHQAFQKELESFLEFMGCDCFPFDWRCTIVLRAVGYMTEGPPLFLIGDQLHRLSGKEENLKQILDILRALIIHERQHSGWYFSEEKILPILKKVISSESEDLRRNALEIQEALLKRGAFEYLDL
jgi:hypothetical protein